MCSLRLAVKLLQNFYLNADCNSFQNKMIYQTFCENNCKTLLETRMSKGSSGCFFSHFFLLSGGFLSVIVGKKRETRHLKAETLGFQKIKFLILVEYSTPPEWGLSFTCGPKKVPFHGAENDKKCSCPKKSIFSKTEISIPQSNHGKRNIKTKLVRP